MQVKDYNAMVDRENFLYQPIKNMLTYDNIQNITSGQGFDYTIGCLLGYPYLIKYYKLIAIDLRKQQACNANPKAKQQIILQEICNEQKMQ